MPPLAARSQLDSLTLVAVGLAAAVAVALMLPLAAAQAAAEPQHIPRPDAQTVRGSNISNTAVDQAGGGSSDPGGPVGGRRLLRLWPRRLQQGPHGSRRATEQPAVQLKPPAPKPAPLRPEADRPSMPPYTTVPVVTLLRIGG
ncbi:hypothetical protein HYH03_009953 [Edaphochlamys debaryana]|uniref:Uncharacterized protein n=1 Tax=Edaphochlamys debaryana TaxID=47281 RepID=A0A835XX20_9CHLO|nr:hypothetical protein HYH03_009953 [Edaphochlamys debaryana]|eukprot:KAG2491793.1 hypothetical protein HYH03_009953 [Edaphochlamys debaryana]